MSILFNPLEYINKGVYKNLFLKQTFNKLKPKNAIHNNQYYNTSSYLNIQKKAISDKTAKKQMKLKKSKGPYKGNKIKYKTEICKLWAMNKQCKFGDKCLFAHGETEIQKNEENVKESDQREGKICFDFFKTGYCLDGAKCKLRHSHYSAYFSFASSLKKLSQTPAEAIKQDPFVLSKRLNVFHLLTQDNSDVLSTEECESNSNESLKTKEALFNNDDLSMILPYSLIKSNRQVIN